MAPRGRELVRLPWTTPHADRRGAARDRQSQHLGAGAPALPQRAHLARRARGWLEASADDDGGPVALLLDRLRTVGHLPALPGLATRVQRVTSIESQRTDEIARHLLPDMALVVRAAEDAQLGAVQGTQIPGNGPVLTLRRVVALIGVDGVRAAAEQPARLARPARRRRRARAAARRSTASASPATRRRRCARRATTPEAVYLSTVLQNLGRLLLRYHFADEAEQIHQLMQPVPAPRGDGERLAEQPGLDEEAAAYAVLGVDIESLGSAAARHWGLGDDILHMIRRLPADAPVRKPDSDDELLRHRRQRGERGGRCARSCRRRRWRRRSDEVVVPLRAHACA